MRDADNTWKNKKDAANAKAVAQKEIATVEAENALMLTLRSNHRNFLS